VRADYLPLASLLHPTAPAALDRLDPLPLRHPALEEPQEFTLVRVVAPVIKGHKPGAIAFALLVEEGAVRGLAGDPVGVLGHDHRDAPLLHHVPHLVQARPLQVGCRPALVSDLGQNLVALA
jgi:hypothetical protein